MDLRHLTDEVLLAETAKAVKHEKQATLVVLYHIQEVNRRRLFCDLQYGSIIDYLEGSFGFDRQEAYRRMAAMNLLTELPEIAPSIENGKLNLTQLNVTITHFNKEEKARGEKLTSEQKKEVLRKVVGVSTRKTEQVLANEASYEVKKTKSIEVDLELLDKVQKAKSLMAHSHPNLSVNEVLHKAMDDLLEKLSAPKKTSVPVAVDRAVRKRDGKKCVKCGSIHALQLDHFPIPKSMGGPDTVENLRLLCRSCNQRAAINFFGADKMEPFLNS